MHIFLNADKNAFKNSPPVQIKVGKLYLFHVFRLYNHMKIFENWKNWGGGGKISEFNKIENDKWE